MNARDLTGDSTRGTLVHRAGRGRESLSASVCFARVLATNDTVKKRRGGQIGDQALSCPLGRRTTGRPHSRPLGT
jgi:hypothetical protein